MYMPQTLKLTDEEIDVVEASGFGAIQGLGDRPALLVIDVNYRFVGEKDESTLNVIRKWPTACGKHAWSSIPYIKKCIEKFRRSNLPIFYTTGDNRNSLLEHGRWAGKNRRVTAEKRIIDGNKIVDVVAPSEKDYVLFKAKPSAFFGTSLMSYLNELNIDSIIVIGGTTSGCIRATAVDAFSYNFKIAVIHDAVFDRFLTSHEIGLFDMGLKYADVMSTQQVIEFIDKLGIET